MISRRCALIILAAAAGGAEAQSTASLGGYERPAQFQLSVATNSAFIGSQYGDQTGALRAIDVAVHFRTDGPMQVRLDAWAINRRPRTDSPYGDRLTQSTAFALIGSGEFPIRLPGDVAITPEVGFGWVPHARGTFEPVQGSPGDRLRTSTGLVYSAGLALRWNHLVIEQHLLQIIDADRAILNGETAPLSFGLRF